MKLPPIPTAGYLVRVVEQVLPTQPLLLRRQPSLYEAAQPGAGMRWHENADAADADTPPVGAVPSVLAAPLLPTARVAAVPAVVAAPPAAPSRAAVVDTAVRPPAAGPSAVPASASQAPALPRQPPRVDTTVRSVTVIAPPRAAAVAATAQAAAAPAADTPHRNPAPRAVEPVQGLPRPPAQAAVQAAPATPRRAAAPAATPAPLLRPGQPAQALSPTTPRPPAALVPALRAAVRAAWQTSVRPAAAPPRQLPPVQVTIGRVEVRAVAAPIDTATARSCGASPRLSLDQYLHERNGGSR